MYLYVFRYLYVLKHRCVLICLIILICIRYYTYTVLIPINICSPSFLLRALSSLRGLRGAPEVPPLCRETQSLGQQMLGWLLMITISYFSAETLWNNSISKKLDQNFSFFIILYLRIDVKNMTKCCRDIVKFVTQLTH